MAVVMVKILMKEMLMMNDDGHVDDGKDNMIFICVRNYKI